MATVPNWIAKGYAYNPRYGMRGAQVYKILSWRATRTQVVVELEGLIGEYRFRLDDLVYAYRQDERRRRMVLVARAVDDLRSAIDSNRLDASAMDAEALVVAIGRIQRAATKALADLAGVL
jgi:hypothetical protein